MRRIRAGRKKPQDVDRPGKKCVMAAPRREAIMSSRPKNILTRRHISGLDCEEANLNPTRVLVWTRLNARGNARRKNNIQTIYELRLSIRSLGSKIANAEKTQTMDFNACCAEGTKFLCMIFAPSKPLNFVDEAVLYAPMFSV